MGWIKGQSGNPNGRPKGGAGLAAYVRSKTRSGRDLIDHALEIMRGRATAKAWMRVGLGMEEVEVSPSFRDQAQARDFLAARGFGTPLDAKDLPPDTEPAPARSGDGKVLPINSMIQPPESP